jgi:hypothetical protein
MYAYYPNAGIIVRIADAVQVAPTSNPEGQDYLDWLAWCALGNVPTLGEEPAEPVNQVQPISHFAFLNRFTSEELIAIEMASVFNPNASTEAQLLGAHLRVHQRKFDTSQFIDLNHAETIDGINALETAGLLATGRANEILTTPVEDYERP